MQGTAIVTGGSRGIGAAIARRLAQDGYAVCVNYNGSADRAAAVVEAIRVRGGRAAAIQADVSDPDDVERLFAEAEAALGPITALVNNAGVLVRGPTAEMAVDDIERMIAIDTFGLLLCTQAAVRRMSTAHGGRGGAIVNIGSSSARMPNRNGGILYGAAKGACAALATGLAMEVAAEGIRVNNVSPALVLTEITSPEFVERITPILPMRRPAHVDEVADTVAWLLSSRASYVSGTDVKIGGGQS